MIMYHRLKLREFEEEAKHITVTSKDGGAGQLMLFI